MAGAINWNRFFKKSIKILMGLLICGIGAAMMYELEWGSNSAATMIEGVSIFFNLSYGLAGIIVNILFFILLLFIGRNHIGVGTVLTTFVFGYMIDLGAFLVRPLGIAQMPLALKFLFLVIGCILTAIGLGYYVGQYYGTGAMDAISVIIHERLGIRFSICRWAIDILLMIFGVVLGASWGIGTVATIIFTAPIMELVIRKINANPANID